ncbi:MAG: ECF transporter S component [Trichococcus flocculiformis]
MKTEKNSTYRLVILALFIAFTVVMTLLFRISIPFGYVNLGDMVLLLAGLSFGSSAGFIVGSLGSMLADLFAGYAFYAPITFVVKGLEGFFAGWLFQKMDHKKPLVATVIAGVWMAIGYAIGDTILFSFGAAIASFPLNIAQGLVGAFLYTLLYRWLNPYITKNLK